MDIEELKRRIEFADKNNFEYGKHYRVLQHGKDDFEIIPGVEDNPNTNSKEEPKSTVSKLGKYIKEIDNQEYSGDLLKDLKLSFQKAAFDPMTWATMFLGGAGALPKVASALAKLPMIHKFIGGIAATGAATGGLQVAKNDLTQNNKVAPMESAITAGALAGAAPIAAKGIGEIVKAVKSLVKPTTLKNAHIEQLVKNAKEGNVILKTPGQELSTNNALELEQLASKGKLGHTNKTAIDRIIEAQNESIANKIDNIVGGKVDHNSKNIASENIKKRFKELKDVSKKASEEAYKNVTPILELASLDNNSKGVIYNNLKKHAISDGINKEYYGAANQAINRTLDNIKEATNLLDLEKSRRLLAKEFKYLDNTNKEYLMRFKNELDNSIESIIHMHPDLTNEGLNNLKNARNLYTDYMEKFVTPKNHSVAKFYKLLNNEDTTGSELLEALIKDKSSSNSTLKRLKEMFGENGEEINHLKRAYVYDSLGKVTPEGNILNIKDASKKIHQDFSNDIAKTLFSEKEINGFNGLAKELYNLKVLPKEDINLGRGALPTIANDLAEHHSLGNPVSWIASQIKKHKSSEEFKKNLVEFMKTQLKKEENLKKSFEQKAATKGAKLLFGNGFKGYLHNELTR